MSCRVRDMIYEYRTAVSLKVEKDCITEGLRGKSPGSILAGCVAVGRESVTRLCLRVVVVFLQGGMDGRGCTEFLQDHEGA